MLGKKFYNGCLADPGFHRRIINVSMVMLFKIQNLYMVLSVQFTSILCPPCHTLLIQCNLTLSKSQ